MVKCDFAVIELANVSVGARDSSRDPNTLARRSCSSLTLDSPMCRILALLLEAESSSGTGGSGRWNW